MKTLSKELALWLQQITSIVFLTLKAHHISFSPAFPSTPSGNANNGMALSLLSSRHTFFSSHLRPPWAYKSNGFCIHPISNHRANAATIVVGLALEEVNSRFLTQMLLTMTRSTPRLDFSPPVSIPCRPLNLNLKTHPIPPPISSSFIDRTIIDAVGLPSRC